MVAHLNYTDTSGLAGPGRILGTNVINRVWLRSETVKLFFVYFV